MAQHAEGKLATKHLNVAWLLDDQASGEGCLLVWPGSHKMQGDFLTMNTASYDTPGLALEGSIEVEGKAGDCVVFTEALVHCGDEKLRGPPRRNMYMLYSDDVVLNVPCSTKQAVSKNRLSIEESPVGQLWPHLRTKWQQKLCGIVPPSL